MLDVPTFCAKNQVFDQFELVAQQYVGSQQRLSSALSAHFHQKHNCNILF